jgi:hypothetical protein
VCHIHQGIDHQIPMLGSTVKSPSDSRKGGAVLYGLHVTHERSEEFSKGKPHYVIYTDSDLSSDLAMSGLLLNQILISNKSLACGARYGYTGSFLVKDNGATGHPASHLEQPNVMHITFRHFVRSHLLPDISTLTDTNVGFKCYQVSDLSELLPKMTIFGPAFDMQLLLASLKYYKNKFVGQTGADIIGVCPILFVEDFSESNFTSNETNPDASYKAFIQMDQEICKMSEEYSLTNNDNAFSLELKAFIESLDTQSYKKMINNIEQAMGRELMFGQEFTMEQLKQAFSS